MEIPTWGAISAALLRNLQEPTNYVGGIEPWLDVGRIDVGPRHVGRDNSSDDAAFLSASAMLIQPRSFTVE